MKLSKSTGRKLLMTECSRKSKGLAAALCSDVAYQVKLKQLTAVLLLVLLHPTRSLQLQLLL